MKSQDYPLSRPQLHRMEMFHYYYLTLFPSIFDWGHGPEPGRHYRTTQRGLHYNYHCDEAGADTVCSFQALSEGLKDIYKRKSEPNMLGQIVMSEEVRLSLPSRVEKITETIEIIVRPQSCQLGNGQRIGQGDEVYLIHRSFSFHDSSPSWQHLIERFTLRQARVSSPDHRTITREILFIHAAENILALNQSSRILELYYQQTLKKRPALKEIVSECSEQTEQGEKVDNNQKLYRRQLKLRSEHLVIFKALQHKAQDYYRKLHSKVTILPQYIDNLVCRIMTANSYDQNNALKDIKYYLDTEKYLKDKYTMDSFKQYQAMKILEWPGRDHQDRPVMVFRIANQKMSQIPDHEKYLDYFNYMAEFYSQQQMKGWSDEAIALADAGDFGLDNFNLSVMKGVVDRTLAMNTLTCPEKIIIYNNGMLIKGALSLLKQLLPKEAESIIAILGTDQAEIRQELSKYMPGDVIDKCLAK